MLKHDFDSKISRKPQILGKMKTKLYTKSDILLPYENTHNMTYTLLCLT